jgi:hypothetical protein
MKLQPSEEDLVGKWIFENGKIRKDDVCERIECLIKNSLKQVSTSKLWGGWETLYQDPEDGRYWERTYPMGEMQGGGPPRLKVLSLAQAREKYEIE